MGQFHEAAKTNEIPQGTGKKVTLNGCAIALFHVNGAFHAIDDACPHRQGPLSDGSLNGSIVACPWHGWTFDLNDGSCRMNPTAKVGVYKTKIENNSVFVHL